MSALSDFADVVLDNQQAFLRGIGLTLELLALSTVIALVLAIPLALMRTSQNGCSAGSPMAICICFAARRC